MNNLNGFKQEVGSGYIWDDVELERRPNDENVFEDRKANILTSVLEHVSARSNHFDTDPVLNATKILDTAEMANMISPMQQQL